MPKIIVQIEWDMPNEPFWLNADNVAIALHSYCKNTKFKVSKPTDMSASEAVFGFVAWLTSRSERITMSSKDEAGVACDLVVEFCKTNHLAEPRTGWTDALIHPAARDEKQE